MLSSRVSIYIVYRPSIYAILLLFFLHFTCKQLHTYVRKYVIFLVFIRQDSRTQLDKENVASRIAQLRKSKSNIFLFCDKI